mmetsp:Transcript_64313/g.171534  ORF Transcript_64313/g.171534 Transcript_64313/m.171534 type:complete len:216 (+) Transcript_64313:1524-2171(+)
MQVVEDLVHRPHVLGLLEERNLLLRLVLHACTELAEGLELIDELIDHVPQPLVGKLQRERPLALEEQVEDIAVVEPRLDALLQGRLQLRVDVPVVQLLVEQEELLVRVDEGRDRLGWRPGRRLVVPVGELVEAVLIDRVHFVHVAIANVLLEVDDERADHVGEVVAREVRGVCLRLLIDIKLGGPLETEVGQVVDLDAVLNLVEARRGHGARETT